MGRTYFVGWLDFQEAVHMYNDIRNIHSKNPMHQRFAFYVFSLVIFSSQYMPQAVNYKAKNDIRFLIYFPRDRISILFLKYIIIDEISFITYSCFYCNMETMQVRWSYLKTVKFILIKIFKFSFLLCFPRDVK